MAARVKKGDRVVVTTGRDKGKTGEVLSVLPKEDRVVVQGVNMIKRHTRASQTQAGGIIEREAAMHLSNVMLADPKTGEPTRVGFKVLDDGRKVRVAKRSGEVIDA
ncbi:ribosomal protein L24 [alpha proteobacterium BAL199]|jgi:large subunit ribosomal protein L24|nr:ribosomal protein L24 [alpha proteobacterium BAL199]